MLDITSKTLTKGAKDFLNSSKDLRCPQIHDLNPRYQFQEYPILLCPLLLRSNLSIISSSSNCSSTSISNLSISQALCLMGSHHLEGVNNLNLNRNHIPSSRIKYCSSLDPRV